MRRVFLLTLAALSGGAGLAYEVSWTRNLAWVAGNSTRAMAVVLSVFLGGMALGGVLSGARWFVHRNPARLGATLLLMLAALGFVIPHLVPRLGWLLIELKGVGLPLSVARTALLLLVLLPPAVLMGLTFPLWVRLLASLQQAHFGRSAALISAAQVVGAGLGALVAGFVIIPSWGFAAASFAGATLDVVVACGLLVLSTQRLLEPEPQVLVRALSPWRTTSGFIAAGAASLGYQVIWTRALVFYFDGLHHAFVAVLVTYLVGLGLGAAAVAVLAPRVRTPASWLAGAQILGGLAGLLTLLLVGLLGRPVMAAARAGAGWEWTTLGLCSALLIVPAALFGTTVPLALWIRSHRGGALGSSVGRAYGQTTLGNSLGALLVPLVLVPSFSLRTSWALLAILNAAAAMFLSSSRRGRSAAAALIVIGGATAYWTYADPRSLLLDSHVFLGSRGLDREIVFSADGESSTVAVVQNLRQGTTVLYTDTFAAAATGREYPYMSLLGHLPVLLCEHPRRVLVICFGTGTTAGAVSLHPDVDEIRVVDVEPIVFGVAGHFLDVNHGVLLPRERPRVVTAAEDGRLDLLLDRDGYDVITLEPLMPYTQGAVSFYTREFYELARDRLRPGGTVCQWIPIHAMKVADYRSLVRTFMEVFPGGELYVFEQSSLLLARSDRSPIPWNDVALRARHAPVAEDLRQALVEDAWDLFAARVAGGPVLAQSVAEDPVLTDDRPRIIFLERRPEALGFRWLSDTLEFLVATAAAEARAHPVVELVGIAESDAVRLGDLRETRRGLLFARLQDARWRTPRAGPPKATPQDPVLAALERALLTNPDHLEGRRLLDRRHHELSRYLAVDALRKGHPLEVLALLAPAKGTPDWDRSSDVLLGMALMVAGDADGAREILDRVLFDHPKEVSALVVRSAARRALGEGQGARSDGDLAQKLDSRRADRERRFLADAEEAARGGGLAPLTLLRDRLAAVLENDVLASPKELEAALLALQIQGGAPLLPLLARRAVELLEGPPVSETRGLLEAARTVAVLGVERTRDRLEPWAALAESNVRRDLLRALAALVPRDEARVSAIWKSEDPVRRRLFASAALGRGDRAMAELLVPGLRDADPDVRLYTDRALRGLAGGSVNYDFLASAEEREEGARRWEARLREGQ